MDLILIILVLLLLFGGGFGYRRYGYGGGMGIGGILLIILILYLLFGRGGIGRRSTIAEPGRSRFAWSIATRAAERSKRHTAPSGSAVGYPGGRRSGRGA